MYLFFLSYLCLSYFHLNVNGLYTHHLRRSITVTKIHQNSKLLKPAVSSTTMTYPECEPHTTLQRHLTFLWPFFSTCLSVSCHRASSSCCFLRASATALASALRALAVAALEFSPWNFFGIPTAALQLRDKGKPEIIQKSWTDKRLLKAEAQS